MRNNDLRSKAENGGFMKEEAEKQNGGKIPDLFKFILPSAVPVCFGSPRPYLSVRQERAMEAGMEQEARKLSATAWL
jgi:hypothetical protein